MKRAELHLDVAKLTVAPTTVLKQIGTAQAKSLLKDKLSSFRIK